jgi:hypothetical protein
MTKVTFNEVPLVLINFDEKVLIEYLEMLIDADEVERALIVLDNVPGYYRDNPTPGMRLIREQIMGAMITPHAYMSSGLDANVRPDAAISVLKELLRGRLVLSEVRRKFFPKPYHVVDVGPGEYWFPLALDQLGLDFTYVDIVMDQNTQKVAHPLLLHRRLDTVPSVTRPPTETPCLYLALEIIEHLPEPRDLAIEAVRWCGKWPERIHLSTPRYTFDGAEKDWRKPCGLPHLRTYTPREFIAEVQRIFPTYHLELFEGQIMSIRGQRSDTIDPVPLSLEIDF